MDRGVVSDDVLCHEDAGEAFLLHVPSGRYFGLNPAGLLVWKAVAAGQDPVEALTDRWPDTPKAVLAEDTERMLTAFEDAGLIQAASKSEES